MTAVHTEIEIDAPADRVWQELLDFAAWPSWSTIVKRLEGPAELGARLKLRIVVFGLVLPLAVKIVEFDPGERLAWTGAAPLPGLFSAIHSFAVVPLGPGRCRLVHEEHFTGLLFKLIRRSLLPDLQRNYDLHNSQLKARCEARA